MTLKERIKNISLTLQKPFYFFSLLSNGDIMFVLEDEEGKRNSFREETIAEVIKTAERYVEHETKMGSLKLKEKTETLEETETSEEEAQRIKEETAEEMIKQEKTEGEEEEKKE